MKDPSPRRLGGTFQSDLDTRWANGNAVALCLPGLQSYWILNLCHVLWVTLGLQCAVWKLILEIPFKHIYIQLVLFPWKTQIKTLNSFLLEGKKQRNLSRNLFNRTKPSLQRESGVGCSKEGQQHSGLFIVGFKDAPWIFMRWVVYDPITVDHSSFLGYSLHVPL